MRVGNLSSYLYADENPPHFIHEYKTIAYDVIDVYVFLHTLMRFLHKKEDNSVLTILMADYVESEKLFFPMGSGRDMATC